MEPSGVADARRRLTDAAAVNGFKLGALAARFMPWPVTAGAAASLGFGASLSSPAKREIFQRHLRRIDPTMTRTAMRLATQRAFDSYARYYAESFRLPTLSRRAVERGFEVEGYDRVTAALEHGNGVILALPHLGGWEWAGRWMTDRGHRMTVVVEPLQPPELFEWFADLRKQLGMTVVPLGSGAASAVLKALRDNEVVCLLCDRDLERNGVEVEFFGERTTLPAGPAALSLRSGAPVLPTAVYFTPRYNGHLGVVRPPLPSNRTDDGLRADVSRVSQVLAHELEVLIRRAPEQWHMFQPNWPSDPGY
ncbi:MAG: phosphatidylinositol mannoside acyltransferase [Ilumatobacteraceae bacterium]